MGNPLETGQIEWRGRVRLVDEVTDVLRERIYAGVYAPGAALRQEQLAADLDISRTPLREALRVLESEGLVRSEPGRGVRVVSVDARTLLAGYEVREVLDGLAARLAARRAEARDLAVLEAHLDDQRAALQEPDIGTYTRANVAFHTAIVDIAGNDFVVAQLSLIPLTAQVFTPARRIAFDRVRTSVAEHEAIVAAIAAGDEDAAESAARAHIRVTIDQLAASVADDPEKDPLR
ncbi:putative regulator PutR for proline utilization GntR family [Patulibacter medicamentivorans]|uniref:Putative regulator PutR for proline utilization GntR family n=1 Tax=Patulibacter medicamentivorans TaxID=1097667 RepID=H0E716_9ACTN|nr:GntR family transcriptional regulator [Patulibacter medicamentivorans]EHN10511.1 putative regulator PutR for proline utilization GntR family [Patulibacter medicamentivorans]